MIKLYFLLFLLGPYNHEGPIGIFQSMDECRSHGEQITRVVMRKFDCIPATEAALRYFRGECSGRPEDCKLIGGGNVRPYSY